MSEDRMNNYWISWYYLPPKRAWGWEYHGPWWVSGVRDADDAVTICAAVQAESEDDAMEAIYLAYDQRPENIDFRFVEDRGRDWNPLDLGGRFPAADWMVWPMNAEKNATLRAQLEAKGGE